MFFNSLQFAYFLPIVFLLYWFMPNKSKTSQNYILIIASYYFYSCWDWRFLFLLLFSTILVYFAALKIENKILLLLGVGFKNASVERRQHQIDQNFVYPTFIKQPIEVSFVK